MVNDSSASHLITVHTTLMQRLFSASKKALRVLLDPNNSFADSPKIRFVLNPSQGWAAEELLLLIQQ